MTPNPAQVNNMRAFRWQAADIDRKLDESQRRRANGYRGPLTRADVARLAAQRYARS